MELWIMLCLQVTKGMIIGWNKFQNYCTWKMWWFFLLSWKSGPLVGWLALSQFCSGIPNIDQCFKQRGQWNIGVATMPWVDLCFWRRSKLETHITCCVWVRNYCCINYQYGCKDKTCYVLLENCNSLWDTRSATEINHITRCPSVSAFLRCSKWGKLKWRIDFLVLFIGWKVVILNAITVTYHENWWYYF